MRLTTDHDAIRLINSRAWRGERCRVLTEYSNASLECVKCKVFLPQRRKQRRAKARSQQNDRNNKNK